MQMYFLHQLYVNRLKWISTIYVLTCLLITKWPESLASRNYLTFLRLLWSKIFILCSFNFMLLVICLSKSCYVVGSEENVYFLQCIVGFSWYCLLNKWYCIYFRPSLCFSVCLKWDEVMSCFAINLLIVEAAQIQSICHKHSSLSYKFASSLQIITNIVV